MSIQRGLCDICHKEKILKFSTPRLSICDLCLKKVSGAKFDLSSSENLIKQIIDENYPLCTEESAHTEARNIIYSNKNSLSKIISVIYESNKTTTEIETLARKIREERNSAIIKIRNEKSNNFLRIKIFNEFKLTRNETNQVYIYKSFLMGLLNQNGEYSERLSPEEMQNIRNKIIISDGLACGKCHKSGNIEYHLHHIIPLHKYGTNNPANLILLCVSCHQKQHKDFKISKNFVSDKKINQNKWISIKCPFCKNTFKEKLKSQWIVCPICNYEIKLLKSQKSSSDHGKNRQNKISFKKIQEKKHQEFKIIECEICHNKCKVNIDSEYYMCLNCYNEGKI